MSTLQIIGIFCLWLLTTIVVAVYFWAEDPRHPLGAYILISVVLNGLFWAGLVLVIWG
jgi:hypothetical protein